MITIKIVMIIQTKIMMIIKIQIVILKVIQAFQLENNRSCVIFHRLIT